MTTPIQRPPHRFREEQFRRYEWILEKVRENFPNKTTFTPTNFTAETVSCRLRDCVRALYKNPVWNLELEKWCREFWSTRQVSHDGTKVTIDRPHPKGEVIVEAKLDADVNTVMSNAPRLVVDKPTMATFGACCVLITAGVITEPVVLNNLPTGLKVNFDTLIQNTYRDLVLMPQPDKSNTFLLI